MKDFLKWLTNNTIGAFTYPVELLKLGNKSTPTQLEQNKSNIIENL